MARAQVTPSLALLAWLVLSARAVGARPAFVRTGGRGGAGVGTAGHEFYVGLVLPSSGGLEGATVELTIATDASSPVTVSVTCGLPDPQCARNITVATDRPEIVFFDSAIVQLFGRHDTQNIGTGDNIIHVEAGVGGEVTVRVLVAGPGFADGFAALPCDPGYQVTSTTQHNYVASYGAPQETGLLLVVSCHDDTLLGVSTIDGAEVVFPGQPSPTLARDFTLSRGQALYVQLQATAVAAGSGFRIRASGFSPVFVGQGCGSIPGGVASCGYMYEQLPSHFMWGTQFFTAPQLSRGTGEIFHIVTIQPTTLNMTCTVDHTPQGGGRNISTLSPEQLQVQNSSVLVLERRAGEYCCIQSDVSIFVTQFTKGYAADNATELSNYGAPFRTHVPPVSQYRNGFVFRASNQTRRNFLSVIVPVPFFDNSPAARQLVTLNDAPVSLLPWRAVLCAGPEVCAYGTEVSVDGAQSYHVAHGNSSAMLLGFLSGSDSEQSYGFPAGFNLDPVRLSILELSSRRYDIVENAGNVTITVRRSGDITLATPFTLNISSPSAGDSVVMGELLPGQRVMEVLITIADDLLPEEEELLNVSLGTSASTDSAILLQPRGALVVIHDDDLITVSLVNSRAVVTEAEGAVTALVRLSRPNPGPTPFIVSIFTEEGSATEGEDYEGIDALLIFVPGDQVMPLLVRVRDDDLVELGQEEFTVRIAVEAGPGAGPVRLGNQRQTITIIDINQITLELRPSTLDVAEDRGVVNLSVIVTGTTLPNITINLATVANTSTANEDFIAINRQLVISTNITEVPITVVINQDSSLETDEIFFVVLSLPEGEERVRFRQAEATVNILNDDTVIFTFAADQQTQLAEGAGNISLSVLRIGQTQQPITVRVQTMTLSNAAREGEDFLPLDASLTFEPNDTELVLSIVLIDDVIVEQPERFQAVLSVPGGEVGVATGTNVLSFIILSDDDVTVGFEEARLTVSEGAGLVPLRLVKTGETVQNATVAVSTIQDTATEGEDYAGVGQEVVFAPAETDRLLLLQLHDDRAAEPTERLFVRLVTVGDGVVIAEGRGEVEILLEDDDAVTLRLQLSSPVVEEGGSVSLTLLKEGQVGATARYLVLHTTTSAADFVTQPLSGELVFGAGASSASITLETLDDEALEATETFEVAILRSVQPEVLVGRNATINGTISATINATIAVTDNDIVRVVFVSESYVVSEGALVSPTLQKVGVAEIAISVWLESREGTAKCIDFVCFARNVTFEPSESQLSLNATATNPDARLEATEEFSLLLTAHSTRVITGPAAIVRIMDTDVVRVQFAGFSAVVAEGDMAVNVSLVVEGRHDIPIGVLLSTRDLSARAPGDYQAVAGLTVTIQPEAGAENVSVTMAIVEDLVLEGPEEFSLVVEAGGGRGVQVGGRDTLNITILEQQAVAVQFAAGSYSVLESVGSASVCVRKDGRTQLPVRLRIDAQESEPPSARAGVDFTAGPAPLSLPGDASEVCTTLSLAVPNSVALELKKTFSLSLTLLSRTQGLRLGAVSTATVNIVDDFTVEVSGEDVSVAEGNGSVSLCLRLSSPAAVPVEVRLSLLFPSSLGLPPAEAGDDVIASSQSVHFAEGQQQTCASYPIVLDNIIEGNEVFCVSLRPTLPAVISPAPSGGCHIIVTIIDAGLPPPAICQVQDGALITTFQGRGASNTTEFTFDGECEHVLVRECQLASNFSVSVDFVESTLAVARAGLRLGRGTLVVTEGRQLLLSNFGSPVRETPEEVEYSNGVMVTQRMGLVEVGVARMGVALTVGGRPGGLVVSVAREGAVESVCGLCGTLEGVLLHSDRTTTTASTSTNPLQLSLFADSWRAVPGDQLLRDQRAECGFLDNDTVIGDPLFTVPLHDRDSTSPTPSTPLLCFEIHGAAYGVFNLISDRCTSVNARYLPMTGPANGNIIGTVGIRAVDSQGQCVTVEVGLGNGCVPIVAVGGGAPRETSRYEVHRVSVRKFGRRVRVAVPNCENVRLSMWLSCRELVGQTMVEFEVTRGVNLRPTSHGLVGQFWNVPLTFERFNYTGSSQQVLDNFASDSLYVVRIEPPSGRPRSFVAQLYRRAWDRRQRPCYYAGSSQAGPLHEFVGVARDSVIAGTYLRYLVDGLHGTQFSYSQFESALCSA